MIYQQDRRPAVVIGLIQIGSCSMPGFQSIELIILHAIAKVHADFTRLQRCCQLGAVGDQQIDHRFILLNDGVEERRESYLIRFVDHRLDVRRATKEKIGTFHCSVLGAHVQRH